VRALVAPMRESNSRSGKQEVVEQFRGKDHGIKLVYLSPERMATAQFQGPLRKGIQDGHIRMIALDEAHTFISWGDDFRPAFRRAANLLRELCAEGAHIVGLTATAKQSVREGIESQRVV
ncbi:MAG: DEAD/DEAH box helicase, partial [Stenotrophomonas sp.]